MRPSTNTPRGLLTVLALAALAPWLSVACGGDGSGPAVPGGQGQRLQVVATTALLADMASKVGGALVDVRAIVPPGAEVHSFQTTPDDSIAISRGRLIVSNGYGLDSFLDPVVRSAKRGDAVNVVAAQGLNPASADVGGAGAVDPHFWQNPEYAIHYVLRILDGLMEADPTHAPEYKANADAYIQELRDLDLEIALVLGRVRPERRRLVTFHDAFGHFGQRYGWQVTSLVGGDAGDVSPGAIVEVLRQVAADGLPAVFVEPQFQPDVMQQAAAEAGVAVGIIYSDTLDKTATSYVEMMRTNARNLAALLE